jgi:hypothetical protein
MARRRKRNGGERFVKLDHYILKSAAWAALEPDAVKVLLAVWMRYNGMNNGEITFSIREAEPFGLKKDRAARAFKQLQALGFLEMTRDSGFNVKTRASRVWRLTMLPTGTRLASKEFMRWASHTANAQV